MSDSETTTPSSSPSRQQAAKITTRRTSKRIASRIAMSSEKATPTPSSHTRSPPTVRVVLNRDTVENFRTLETTPEEELDIINRYETATTSTSNRSPTPTLDEPVEITDSDSNATAVTEPNKQQIDEISSEEDVTPDRRELTQKRN